MICAASTLAIMVIATVAWKVAGFGGSAEETVGPRLQPPSAAWPLGTDTLGRSLMPRVLEGIGTTLVLCATAVAVSAVLSVLLGMLAGYLGGAVSEGVSRLVDLVYAFPALVLAILVSAVLGPGRKAAIIAIVFITIPLMTRMVRAASRSVAGRDFVTVARIAGVSTPRILATHIAPNIAGTIAIQVSYALSVAILVEGGLSFLGYGVQVPSASLGSLVGNGMGQLTTAPWLVIAPGTALVASIVSINVIGDALCDRFEPRQTRELS
jgi:peptide/nickel transport system permease protein